MKAPATVAAAPGIGRTAKEFDVGKRTTCSIDECNRTEQARGMCAPHYGTWHRRNHPTAHTFTCRVCGAAFKASRPNRSVCSRACGNHLVNEAQRTNGAKRQRVPAIWVRPPVKRPEPIPRTHVYMSGQCKHCQVWFIAPTNRHVTCSLACKQAYRTTVRRIAKDRRRARQKTAFVENVYRKQIYERDGYRCHLCRRLTDPTQQVPHPRAPTLDHIIPLARGGMHEPSNCRTACFRCNALKGDRGGGEQLALIG